MAFWLILAFLFLGFLLQHWAVLLGLCILGSVIIPIVKDMPAFEGIAFAIVFVILAGLAPKFGGIPTSNVEKISERYRIEDFYKPKIEVLEAKRYREYMEDSPERYNTEYEISKLKKELQERLNNV